jgi:hypothetical protein
MCIRWDARVLLYQASSEDADSEVDLLLPPEEFYRLNLVCKDYARRSENVQAMRPGVRTTLHGGLLYGVSYMATHNPSAYYRVVRILDKELQDRPELCQIRDCWLDESVEKHKGRLVVATLLPMLQALWIRLDADEIIPIDPQATAPTEFHIRVNGFWDYVGKRYGGTGRIEQPGYAYDNFWVIFSVESLGTYNFTDRRGDFHITIGPEKHNLWRGRWPQLQTGSPRLRGVAQLESEDAR